jgi:hypothetical protein
LKKADELINASFVIPNLLSNLGNDTITMMTPSRLLSKALLRSPSLTPSVSAVPSVTTTKGLPRIVASSVLETINATSTEQNQYSHQCTHRSLSASPDYTNYETWHRNNYEDPPHQRLHYHHDEANTSHVNGSHRHQLHGLHNHLNARSTIVNAPSHDGLPRTSVLMELSDRVGALHDVLKYYWKYDVNITRIESRPVSNQQFDFFVDFNGKVGDANVNALLNALKGMTDKLLVLDEKEVQWFPRHISELDLIANRTLDAGTDLEANHPGFHDGEYRKRRAKLAQQALNYRIGQEIPQTKYTEDEVKTWGIVWDQMEDLWDKYACKEYKASMNLMKKHCNYNRNTIPQISFISSFLQLQTNFRLRPVAGLISSRDFLNGLAFRTFFCTQYIRHPSMPLYTPEPDICHELLGHVPMFADRDFCDFSQACHALLLTVSSRRNILSCVLLLFPYSYTIGDWIGKLGCKRRGCTQACKVLLA